MKAWGEAVSELPEAPVLGDVTRLTDAEIQVVRASNAALHSAVDQLHAIQVPTTAPAALVAAHQKLVGSMDALLAMIDKIVISAENRDQAAFDMGSSFAATLSTAFDAATNEWGNLIQATVPSS